MENCASKDTLLRHRTILVQDMNITQLKQILDAIYSKKMITQEEHDLVKSCPLSQDCARHLLDIINSKGEKVCCRFLKRLKKVNKELWKKVTGKTASKQRGRKKKAECEVEVRPGSDRSTPEAPQPCCDNGGTWECKVSEDTQAGKIRLCLSRHPQCLSREDSPTHQGQESPGMVSDSSSSRASSTSMVYSHSNEARKRSTRFALNIKAQILKRQSGTRAKKAWCQLKSSLRQYSKNIKKKVFKICDQSFVRVKRVHKGSLLCTVYLETYQALQRFVSRDHTDLCTVLKEAIITPEMEVSEGEEVVVSMEVLPSHSQENEDKPGESIAKEATTILTSTETAEEMECTPENKELDLEMAVSPSSSDSSYGIEDIVLRKKRPPDEAPSCSYTEGKRIHEPKLEMYQPPPTPVETPPLKYNAVCGSHQDGDCACHEQEHLYPTPEDAWAWLHCVEEFFQKDSTAAMDIRTSWSANQLVKHIIRDRYFHPYLCYYWQEKALFPNSFSDFMDYLVFTSAQDFCVKNGVNLPDISFKSKCVRLGEIAFVNQTAYGSNCQLAVEEDLPALSFGWLKKCGNSPTERSPGHGQPCIYVHDSIRQYLMACWIAHVIGDPSLHLKLSGGLSSFYEIASSLPITCYCLANFLGKLSEPMEKVFSMVGPLLQVWIAPMTDFQRFLLTTIIVESKQCTLLTGVLSCLFPNGLVDLTSFPDLSYHNLHALKTVIEETGTIKSLKLPGSLTLDTMMDPYPFNSDEPVNLYSDKTRCIPYVSLIQCLRIEERKQNPTCNFADVNIVYIRCNGDNPMAVRHIVQFLPELKTLELRPQTKFDLRALNYIDPALVFTSNLSSVIFGK